MMKQFIWADADIQNCIYFQSNVEVRVCGENRKNDIADNAYLRYNEVANN